MKSVPPFPYKNNGGKRNKHFGLVCYYCKKPNHIANDCRFRMANLGGSDANKGAGRGYRDTTGSKPAGDVKKPGPVTCYKCKMPNHVATHCLYKPDFA